MWHGFPVLWDGLGRRQMTKVLQGMAALSKLLLWGRCPFQSACLRGKEVRLKGEALEGDFSPLDGEKELLAAV